MSIDELKIIKAKTEHLPRIIEIENDAFEFPWKDKERFLSSGQIYLCTKGGSILGYILFKNSKNSCRIIKIASTSNERRSGIGGSMLTWLKSYLEDIKIRQITLNVRESNTSAINFYLKNGFHISEEINNFYKKSTHESAIKMDYTIKKQRQRFNYS